MRFFTVPTPPIIQTSTELKVVLLLSAPKDKFVWSSKGAALGLFSGGVIGVIAGFIPLFHWEMAGLVLIPFTCLGGLIAGILGATRGLLIGGLAGSLSLGIFWLIFSKTATLSPDGPWGIPIAGTIAVIIASFISSVGASMMIPTAKEPRQRIIQWIAQPLAQ